MIKKGDVVQFTELHKWCGCLGIVTEDRGVNGPHRADDFFRWREKG